MALEYVPLPAPLAATNAGDDPKQVVNIQCERYDRFLADLYREERLEQHENRRGNANEN